MTGQLQPEVSRTFRPFTEYLESSVVGRRFEVIRMASIEALLKAAEEGTIEFAFCTPSAMVELNIRLGARPLATVLQRAGGTRSSPLMAGAVFVRSSRKDLQRLEDVRGKRVLALSPLALGGWLAALREWRQLGVDEKKDFARLDFLFSYEGIADRVCSGKADVGVLAGFALASVEQRCPEGFRVLPAPGGSNPAYPVRVSTRLYPEAAFAALGHVDDSLVSKVIVALLLVPAQGDIARAVNCAGFSAPLSYAPVEFLLQELRVRPFESLGTPTLMQALSQHVREVAVALTVFVVLLFGAWMRARALYRNLKTSESVRHRVFDRSHIPMGVVDPDDWTFVDCNPAAARIYGWPSRESLKGRSIEVVSAPVQYDGTKPEFKAAQQLVDAGDAMETVFEWRHLRPSGEIWDAEIHITGFRTNGKRLLQYTLRDVTASRALERRVHMLARALQSVQECITIGDAEDRILYVNAAFLHTYGYSEEELLGQSVRIVDSDRNRREVREAILQSTLASGWRGELWNRTKSGREILVDLSTAAVYDPSGRAVATIGCARDITEYRALQEQYYQAQKMDGIGRLAGGIAHDFNNLLAVINGYSGLMLRRMQVGDPARENVVAIQEAGARAAEFTRQLLTFSKRQPVIQKPLEIGRIIRDSGSLLGRLVGKKVELRIESPASPDGGDWLVMADESQIHQVLVNLAVNASQAMPEGGLLRIETENVEIGPLQVDAQGVALPTTGEYVLLSVTDTGTGMDAETQSHIFEPFFSTKGEEGSGLGLATVYGIVRQSGGVISVASELGKGTSFRIHLPRTIPSAAPCPTQETAPVT